MIGKYVTYKDKSDTIRYLVIDYSKETRKYPAEIAIIQEFPYFPNYVRQLKIWQRLDKFDVEESMEKIY